MVVSAYVQERIATYKRKLSKVQSETILKTTKRKTEINVGAANRFITAAIPELSSEQKQALRQVRFDTQRGSNFLSVHVSL